MTFPGSEAEEPSAGRSGPAAVGTGEIFSPEGPSAFSTMLLAFIVFVCYPSWGRTRTTAVTRLRAGEF